MFSYLLFLLGLVVGSFLNVVIIRGEEGRTLRGRSRCQSCKHELSARDLIPVLSFVVQKRRCRYCGAVFSWQYPLVELGTALSFLVAGNLLTQFISLDASFVLLTSALLIGISSAIVAIVSDIQYQTIPNGATLILFLLGIATTILREQNHPGFISYDIISAAFFSGLLFLIWFFSKGGAMGFGDVKLIGATSLIVGFPGSIIAFLYAFWIGGIVGIILLLLRLKTLKTRIPFGPFIIIGATLSYFTADYFLQLTNLKLLVYFFY